MVSSDCCELLWIDFHRHMVFKASEMATLAPLGGSRDHVVLIVCDSGTRL